MDLLGMYPNLTLNIVGHNQWNSTNQWIFWACSLRLTLNMVSHNQQNSTNPRIGWACSLTYSNPGYGQSQSTELHQSSTNGQIDQGYGVHRDVVIKGCCDQRDIFTKIVNTQGHSRQGT
jgi:hypothetical protein